MKILTVFLLALLLSAPLSAQDSAPTLPGLLLANSYQPGIDLSRYWVSEKLDGVRAYWNGRQLLSRRGNVYQAPDWFTAALPTTPLDGELWLARGRFDELSGLVRRSLQSGSDWSEVKFMVFDLPASTQIFSERLKLLRTLIQRIGAQHVRMVRQFKVEDHQQLMALLDRIEAAGGEGLMLHRGDSHYSATRSDDLLKVKKYHDAEAVVIAHIPGKGKYLGMLGSLEVETSDRQRFRIGTGFSDEQRRNPPALGSTITYRHSGLTRRGIPRFASFLRIRSLF